MIKKWLKYLWPDSYIVFTQSPEGLNATQYILKGDKPDIVDESSFTISKNQISKDCATYIQEYLSVYPQTQLIFLTSALSCSAVGTCNRSQMAEQGIDMSIVKYVCKKNFSTYISIMDLEEDNLLFKPFQLDYLYSPFFIIDEVRSFYSGIVLVALHRQNRLYISIYKDDVLLYADNVIISGGDFEDSIDMSGDDAVEMDDADFDLNDLGDFEDELDGLDELDDFDSDMEAVEEEAADDKEGFDSIKEDEIESDDELREYDLRVHEALKATISHFYSNEKIESDFVERIQIIDTMALSDNLFELVEDELFCEVDVKHIDLHKECLNLMLKDKS